MQKQVNQLNPQELISNGAGIKVKIKGDDDTKEVEGWAIIDTGASACLIEEDLVEKLSLKQRTDVIFRRRGGPSIVKGDFHPYSIYLQLSNIDAEWSLLVTTSTMRSETFKGEPVIAYIGRDVLAGLKFSYDGVTGEYEVISLPPDPL